MEKRVVIFLVLSLAVILGYDLLLKQLGLLPPTEPVPEPAREESRAPSGQVDVPSAGRALTPAGSPSSAPSDVTSPPTSAASAPALERTVAIETDLVRVVINARGGVISSWELKSFHTAPPDDKPV